MLHIVNCICLEALLLIKPAKYDVIVTKRVCGKRCTPPEVVKLEKDFQTKTCRI